MSLRLTALSPADKAGFEQVLSIYRSTIDRSEQRSEAELRACLARRDYRFIAALDGKTIVGFSICFMPADEPFWLLEYMAVSADRQGGGVGGKLFKASAAAAAKGAVGLLEVDALQARMAGAAQRRRRLAFYARLGCRRLGALRYILPLKVHGTPPPMTILVHAPVALQSLPREQVTRWLTRIYADVYNKRPDDRRLTTMLEGVSADVALKPIIA